MGKVGTMAGNAAAPMSLPPVVTHTPALTAALTTARVLPALSDTPGAVFHPQTVNAFGRAGLRPLRFNPLPTPLVPFTTIPLRGEAAGEAADVSEE